MHGHRLTRTLILAILMILLMPWIVPLSTVNADCPGNVLPNSGFEEGFTERGAGEVKVANAWHAFWQNGPNQEDGYNRRPEYQPEDAARFGRRRVREGNFAQKVFTTFSTHHGGIFQQVNIPAGSTVTLQAWAQVWSSTKDDPAQSAGGQYSASVGIDPTGGTDFNSPNIVWSPRSGALDQWVQLSVQTKATQGTITVYLRGDAEWRVKHNDIYFDEACLTFVAPPPPPTAKPRATATPEPTDTPTNTPVPTETATAVPSPTSTLSPTPLPVIIRVYSFEDQDGDAVRGAGEPLLAGAEIVLSNLQRTPIAAHRTDGSREPFAFDNLAAGSYLLTETDPKGYTSTSPNTVSVAIVEGAELEIGFSNRFLPTMTATPAAQDTATTAPTLVVPTAIAAATATPVPESTGQSLGDSLRGIAGILVAIVALVVSVALRVLRSRS